MDLGHMLLVSAYARVCVCMIYIYWEPLNSNNSAMRSVDPWQQYQQLPQFLINITCIVI